MPKPETIEKLKKLINILSYPNHYIQISKVQDNNVNQVSIILKDSNDVNLLIEFVEKFYKTHNMHWLGNVNKITTHRAGHEDISIKSYTYFDIDGLADMPYEDIIMIAESLKVDLKDIPYFRDYAAIVVSGGGIHIYYKLRYPFKVDTYTKYMYKEMYTNYANSLSKALEVYYLPKYNIDLSLKDISKNARLPFSFNHKRQRPTKVIDVNDNTSIFFQDIEKLALNHKIEAEQHERQRKLKLKALETLNNNYHTNKDQALNYPIRTLCEKLGMEFKKDFARSPFTRDTNPSFKIYEETNTWYCFATGQGGDTIKLVSLIKNLDLEKDFKQILSFIGN